MLITDSFMRFCELTDVNESGPSVEAWNKDIPAPETGGVPPEWAPLVRGWANLALGASTSSSSGISSQAVDGLIDSGLPFSIDTPQENDYFLVDLGQLMNIQNIRLHIPSDRRSNFLRLSVFAYEFPRFPVNPPSGPDVSVYPIATGGGVLDVVNIPTVTRLADGTRVPKAARFIVVRSQAENDFSPMALDEIQVFGSDEMTPDRHPVAVCDPAWGDGWFRAKTFVGGSINDFVWVDVMGDLDWRPTIPPGSTGLDCVPESINSPQVRELAIFEGVSLDGAQNRFWEVDSALSGSLESSSSISHSTRHGAEIDVEVGGVVGSIMAGTGFEINSGVTRAESSEVFWSNSINMGGVVAGIPSTDIAPDCDYMARPFAYRGRIPASTGYTHRPLIVDYLVETRLGSWTHAGGVPPQCLTSSPVRLTVESIGAADVPMFAEPEIYAGTTNYVIEGLIPSASIQFRAPPSVGGNVFDGWTGCDATVLASRQCQVTVETDRTITAEYISSEPQLIAHWPFDGNADDVSGNDFHGQTAGAATFSVGAVDQALDLRNGEGWVDIPPNVLNQLNACSMSVWINLDSYDSGDPANPCCNAIYNEDGFPFNALHSQFIPADDPDKVGWVFGGLTGQQAKVNAPPLDNWTHYVMTYSAADASYQIFTNGALADEGTHAVFGGGSIPKCGSGLGATIGAWDEDGNGSMTRFFDGQIDDLRLYTQELSGADAVALFEERSGFDLTVRSTGVQGVAITAEPASAGGSTNYTVQAVEEFLAVVLTAPETAGSLGFTGWIGCNVVFGPDLRNCEVFMDRKQSVIATYDDTSDDIFRDNFEGRQPSLPPPPPPPSR